MNKFIHLKILSKKGRNIFTMLILSGAMISGLISSAYASSSNPTKVEILQIIKEKKVTLSMNNKSLREILTQIQNQSGVGFALKEERNDDILKRMSINVTNTSIEDVLKTLLKGTGYEYSIIGDSVTIVKGSQGIEPTKVIPEKKLVKGKIIDAETKKPIVGATVLVQGTTIGAISDDKGMFSFTAEVGQVLDITFVGMKSLVFKLLDIKKEIVITMEKDAIAVDDVVVNGYYTRNKESLTGSAVVVKSSDLEKVTSQNLINALQIFDPSFRVADNIDMGSNPNALPDFRIRGNSGLGVISEGNLKGSPNIPTFILDGYEVNVEKIYDLDINRIESVTILKDASATAIYGSRAANGVVVVTTKAPEPGRLRVSYNFTATIQAPDLSDYNLLNATDKLKAEVLGGRYEDEGYTDLQQQLRMDYAERNRSIMEGVDTYWLSQPLHTAFNHKHSLYVEGGDKAVRYSVDVNYQENPGVMKGSKRDRFGAGFQLSYNYKDKLLFKNYITVSKVKSSESNYGTFSEYAKLNPYYRTHDDNGNLIQTYPQHIVTSYVISNPLYQSTLNNQNNNNYLEWANNFDFDWRITNSLRLKARFAYSEKNEEGYVYVSPKMPEYQKYDINVMDRGRAESTNRKSNSWDGNVVLSYNKSINRHSINAVVGGNMQESKFESESYKVKGFANEILDKPNFANAFDETAGGDEGNERLAGAFANLNYSFANKYLFDASFRLDGSSMYGYEKRSSPFWSLGLGWNIHNEKFYGTTNVMNHLKLTGNIGVTGKASFSPYESQTSFQYNREQWYVSSVGATLMAMGNPHLEWEKTTLSDIRLEFGLWNNLLFVSGNYYVKDTKDLLSDVTLPYSTGFKSYKENIGSLRNEGYEINLKAFVVRNENLNINIYGALTHNKNTIKQISNSLKSYNDAIDSEMNEKDKGAKTRVKFMEGESTSAIYAVMSYGINPANGKELFVNRDGSLTYLWNASQQVVCGDTEPVISGTLGANIDYKGFNLNFNFLYEMGGEMYNQTLVDRVENADLAWNVDKRVLNDRWQKAGDIAKFKDIKDKSVSNVSSRFVEKNNLLRLQSVSFSYTLNRELTAKWNIEKVKVGFLMNDVFRLSTMKQERGLSYPFARSFNLNLQVQF